VVRDRTVELSGVVVMTRFMVSLILGAAATAVAPAVRPRAARSCAARGRTAGATAVAAAPRMRETMNRVITTTPESSTVLSRTTYRHTSHRLLRAGACVVLFRTSECVVPSRAACPHTCRAGTLAPHAPLVASRLTLNTD